MGVDYSGDHFGNYRLVRLLGRGGFATVYLGEHLYLKRLAAIKVLRTTLSNQDKERFLEEARLLANLSHPQIVRVLEFAVTPRFVTLQKKQVVENVPFLIMDFVPGNNLRLLFPADSTLSLDVVVNYIKQTAAPLQYAHDRGVIHRDIKPENLLLNEQQQVMLSDFGLALLAPSPDLLSLQDIAGTAPYAAPEQLRGKPVFASDQYALGIIAYEWLCGHRPFEGEDAEVIMQHISTPPPRIRKEKPSIPAAVEDVVLKALAKDSQQRFPSVMAFAQKLEDASQRKSFGLTNRLRAIDKGSLDKELLPVGQPVSLFQENVSAPPFTSPRVMALRPGGDIDLQSSEIESDEKRAASTVSMKRNRQRMLQKVRSFWITGVLEQSLRETSLITPVLREAQDAVARPWNLSLYRSEKHVRSFSSGTHISEVYDQAHGELLILGEAGSGKTTLLLELARILLDRAEQDESHPIPVVFTLCSWAEKQLPIHRWLVDELNSKYQVPYELGELWVRSDLLLPLLDGLDEVAANLRSTCVETINNFRQEHGLSSLVVCSRLTEYLLYPPRVLLQSAIIVQPLTIEQIKAYLINAGGGLEIVYQMIRDDLVMRKLVTTPLMLNIIALAYQGKSPEELMEMRFSEHRFQHLFKTYVEQMLRRHQSTMVYAPQQLTNWLGNLARQMQRSGQTVFYLENIQPVMKDSLWRRFYLWLAVLLPGALIGGLTGTVANVLLFHAGSFGSIYIDAVYGVVMGFLFSCGAVMRSARKGSVLLGRSNESWNKEEGKAETNIRTVLSVGLVTLLCLGHDKGLVAGLANALFMGAVSLPLITFLQRNGKAKSNIGSLKKGGYTRRRRTSVPVEHIKNGVLAGVCCGLTSVITIVVSQPASTGGFLFLLVLALRDSLRNALLGTLLSLLLANNNGIIHRAEIVSWSWKKFWRSFKDPGKAVNSLIIGVVTVLTFAAKQSLQGNMMNSMDTGVTTGLLIVIGFYLVAAILQGISSNNLDDQYRVRANEGIQRSLRHGLVGGAIGIGVAVVCTIVTTILAFTLGGGISGGLRAGFANIIPIGLMGGLLVYLLLGGLAAHQHGVLRFIAWRTGFFPLNVPRFLESAVSNVLMHKVGGGYMFIHRLLLEYFVSLEKKEG
jgi:serine/threonine protein kinase/energy-coupling factor transporter ATP-binding protein EcfA2